MEPIVGQLVTTPRELARALNAGLPSGTLRYGVVLAVFLPSLVLLPARLEGRPDARALLLGMVALLALFHGWLTRMVSARALLGKVDGETRYELDALGFRVSTEAQVTRRAWSAVRWCLEVDPAFLVFSGLGVPQLLLKRAFADEDVARVRALIGPHGRGGEPLHLPRGWLLAMLVLLVASSVAHALILRPA